MTVSRVWTEIGGRFTRLSFPCRGKPRAIALIPCGALLAGCVRGPLSALDPASEVTRSVAALWWWMAAGTGAILLMMMVLGWLAVRRHAPASSPWRGVRLMLVAGGLMLPGIVIATLLAFGLRLDEAQWPPGVRAEAPRAFHADLIAHRWWWEIRYPDLGGGSLPAQAGQPLRTVNVLHVPAGVPIHLRIMSDDVIHGFWVPRIAGKLDAVPGRVNRIRLMVDEPGEYAGVCAEFCGDGHAYMRFTLVAHEPADLQRRLPELAGAAR